MAPSPLRPHDPEQLGIYRLLGRLGEGGMGSVYLGETPSGQPVAVKVIRPGLCSDPDFRARFRSEVKRARQVPPFCTAEVIDADADHVTPYLVVEYVDGPSLADLVRDRGPVTGGNVHSVAIGVAIALAAIHDAGVVHRDLKPANVLFSLGTPKVIDFGIAKALDTTSQHTVPGQILGTIAYMGPERFDPTRAAEVGPTTDIFAWGAVVTYAATGHTPFAPEAMIATAAGVGLPAPDLSRLPQPLLDLVARALNEDPHQRPTAHELLEQLLKAGAAGNSQIRAGLNHRPDLQRAAAAVRRTVHLDVAVEHRSQTPARSGLATLVQQAPHATRRLPPSAVAAVTALALAAGLSIYPLAQHAITKNTNTSTSISRQPDIEDRIKASNDPASRGGSRDTCTLDGPLDVTPQTPKAFTCPTSSAPTHQVIDARVKLGTQDACAAIWTHVVKDNGYRITVCSEHVSLDIDDNGLVRTVAFAELDPPAVPAIWHHLQILTPGTGISVDIDGDRVIVRSRTLPALTRGTVILGIVPHPNRAERFRSTRVTFAGVTVTSQP